MPAIGLSPPKTSLFKSLSKNLKAVTTNPEDFLRIQNYNSDKIRKLLKETYDLTTSKHTSAKATVDYLQELVVEDLDQEQIWQLIELRNNAVFPQFLEKTSKILSLKGDRMQIKYVSNNTDDGELESEDGEDIMNENSNMDDFTDEEFLDSKPSKKKSQKKNRQNGKRSIVDDKFFKLSEMDAFLKAEDEKELKKQNGKPVQDDFSINMFDESLGNDEDDENVCYKDFFDDSVSDDGCEEEEAVEDPEEMEENEDEEYSDKNRYPDENEDVAESSNKDQPEDSDSDKNYDSEGSENEDDNSDNESNKDKVKSSFEDRQERLNQRIRDYEQEILGEKPWQLKGEINATNRPQNSLLEEILEFEATSRPAPIITEETTLKLEDIIRQRIKDQVWDDVELKIKPLNTPQEFRKQLVLDQEKSKESLAHIYEKQYQSEIEKLDPNADAKDAEEPKEHQEIRLMMDALFVKLDALSNFHFTPKPVAPEPKIITNTPAVNLEEVAPVAVSSAKLLAPEEIRKRAKGDILGSNERGRTDKNRERRQKKRKQKAIQKAIEEKNVQKQKMGIKLNKKEEKASITKKLTTRRNVEKMTTSQDTGAMKSSTAFFNKLNETTVLQKNKKKTKPESSSLSAKKLKL